MAGKTPVEALQKFNSNLDKATDRLDEMSQFIRQLEDALQVLEERKDSLKKDKVLQSELAKCDKKIMNLKGAITGLVDELGDTQAKIDRARI